MVGFDVFVTFECRLFASNKMESVLGREKVASTNEHQKGFTSGTTMPTKKGRGRKSKAKSDAETFQVFATIGFTDEVIHQAALKVI